MNYDLEIDIVFFLVGTYWNVETVLYNWVYKNKQV
jgi:hypothetical protein